MSVQLHRGVHTHGRVSAVSAPPELQYGQPPLPEATAERRSMRDLASCFLLAREITPDTTNVGLLLAYAGARATGSLDLDAEPLEIYGSAPCTGTHWRERALEAVASIKNCYLRMQDGDLVFKHSSGQFVSVIKLLGHKRAKSFALGLKRELARTGRGNDRYFARFISRRFELEDFQTFCGTL